MVHALNPSIAITLLLQWVYISEHGYGRIGAWCTYTASVVGAHYAD